MSSSPNASSGGSADDVELNVNTQFLLQLNQETAQPEAAAVPVLNSAPEVLSSTFWDDAAFEFDMADFSNLPDMSTLTMPNETWINGYL